jgi:alkylresorcinol/alkylpyrone synthase
MTDKSALPALLSLGTALPDYSITQAEVLSILARAKGKVLPGRMAEILGNTGIETRNIAMPPEYYFAARCWPDRASTYDAVSKTLFAKATQQALDNAGLSVLDIGQIVCVSTTGMMTPSLPSQMLSIMGFASDTRCIPVFGYGCAGGVIGLSLAADLWSTAPEKPVLLVSLELCSIAYDHARMDKKDMVATALFADGCAAAIVGAQSPSADGPKLAAFGQNIWPDTLDMMGWEIGDTGFDLVLARDIPSFVATGFAPVCDAFLARHGLNKADMAEPVCHPGGGRVVDALAEYFDNDLPVTRAILARHGNMSSPTVLFVLAQMLENGPLKGPTLMTALGPGFVGALGLLLP